MDWLNSLAFPNTHREPWKPQLTEKEWLKWMSSLGRYDNSCFMKHHTTSITLHEYAEQRNGSIQKPASFQHEIIRVSFCSSRIVHFDPRSPRGISVDNQRFSGALNLVFLKRKTSETHPCDNFLTNIFSQLKKYSAYCKQTLDWDHLRNSLDKLNITEQAISCLSERKDGTCLSADP